MIKIMIIIICCYTFIHREAVTSLEATAIYQHQCKSILMMDLRTTDDGSHLHINNINNNNNNNHHHNNNNNNNNNSNNNIDNNNNHNNNNNNKSSLSSSSSSSFSSFIYYYSNYILNSDMSNQRDISYSYLHDNDYHNMKLLSSSFSYKSIYTIIFHIFYLIFDVTFRGVGQVFLCNNLLHLY